MARVLNAYGQEEDPDGLMVPDWAQEAPAPPVQIEAPQGGLDALANVGQPGTPNVPPVAAAEDIKITGPDGQPSIGAMEGPTEGPGDRTMLPPEAMPAPPAPEAPGDPRTTFAPTPPTGSPEIPGLSRNPNASKTTITQNVASPESQAASKDAAGIVEKQIEVERRQSEERQKNLVAEQKAADQQAATQLEKQQRMDALFQEHKARLADLTAKDDAALAAAQGAKFHDYWSDKTTGDRVLAALSVFLGGLGTAYGGENTAMKMLQSNIQRDFDKQKEEIQKKHDFHAVTSKNKAAEQGQLEAELHNVDLQQVAATDAAATQLIAMKAKQGVSLDQAKTDASVLAIQKAANDKRAEIGEKQDARVTQETTAKARGILGGGGDSPAATKYLEMLQNKASPAELNAFAQANRLDQKTQDKLVTRGEKLIHVGDAADSRKEKAEAANDARTLYDPETHKPIALMPSARVVAVAGKDLVAGQEYSRSLRELAADIEANGRVAPGLLGISSEARTRRLNLARDAQAKGRVSSGINATDSGAHLEHEMLGGAGVGTETMASPKVLLELADKIDKRTEHRVRAMGTAIDGGDVRVSGKEAQAQPAQSAQPKAEPTRQAKAAAATRVMSDPSAPPAARKRAKEYLQSLGS